jgi:hypothetical protein
MGACDISVQRVALACVSVLASTACDPVPWYERTVSLQRALQPDCLRVSVRQLPTLRVEDEHADGAHYVIRWRTVDGRTSGSATIRHETDGSGKLYLMGAKALSCSRQDQLRAKEIADALLMRIRANCAPIELSSSELPICSR